MLKCTTTRAALRKENQILREQLAKMHEREESLVNELIQTRDELNSMTEMHTLVAQRADRLENVCRKIVPTLADANAHVRELEMELNEAHAKVGELLLKDCYIPH